MSVSIKVAVRCRPFSMDDKLGVHMVQNDTEDGEINLVNSKYATQRFAFSWSWWSAYGWQRRQKSDTHLSEDMKLIAQPDCYNAVGLKIKGDLLDGNAVVMFAYGLSGSGKTFTVFGPDDPVVPEAWFKHATPHDMWGIFPRLGFDLMAMKNQTWKFKMKYFQNVVDIVRDLMSPTGEEKQYKSGMRKDSDGFMDIEWTIAQSLKSWDDLRNTFQKSNAKKAISPTQFNHQSTRGHCVMTLEVNKPKDDSPELRQKGRVYVCDLAGTEPAGDIVYAEYKKVIFPDGSIEHQYQGPHKNQSLTKNLQDQGKKINLSLSEMAQFFMKMANAIKKNKLKPGKSIPGCNSYFLCKYLKDIMLQARTYLFCAIRPEMSYLKYTFATLGFAKNASVIKLKPKKATAAATPAERKLMQQLEAMKIMMEELKKQNEKYQSQIGAGGGGAVNEEMIAKTKQLEAELEEKRKHEAELAQQAEEAAKQRDELKMQLEIHAKEKDDEVTELKQAMDTQNAEVKKIKLEMNTKMIRQMELAAKAEEATKKQEELQQKIQSLGEDKVKEIAELTKELEFHKQVAEEARKSIEQESTREQELMAQAQAAAQKQRELEAKMQELDEMKEKEVNDLQGQLREQALKTLNAMREAEAEKKEAAALKEKLEKVIIENSEKVDEDDDRKELLAQLEAKQAAMASLMEANEAASQEQQQQKQKEDQRRKEYANRGISLAFYEEAAAAEKPHLINLDSDPFRSKRFMFFVDRPITKFGKGADVQPFSVSASSHCIIYNKGTGKFQLEAAEGNTMHNGVKLSKGQSVALQSYDRVVMGTDITLFIDPENMPKDANEPDVNTCIAEYHNGISTKANDDAAAALQEKLRNFEEEKRKWEEQRRLEDEAREAERIRREEEVAAKAATHPMDMLAALAAQGPTEEELAERAERQRIRDEEDEKRKQEMEEMQMQLLETEITNLIPKAEAVQYNCNLLDRSVLSFELKVQQGTTEDDSGPKVKVCVTRVPPEGSASNFVQSMYIDIFEFEKGAATLQAECNKITMALENDRAYTCPPENDPICLFMGVTSHIGTATMFPEYLGYMLETDEEESLIEIKDAVFQDSRIGTLNVRWFPIEGGGALYTEYSELAEEDMVDELDKLIGHPWAFRVEIQGAYGLPSASSSAYIQYTFFGEIFTTDTLEESSTNLEFFYSFVHRIECVTEEFVSWLEQTSIHFDLYTSPRVELPLKQPVSTKNKKIRENIVGDIVESAFSVMPREELENKCSTLTSQLITKDDTIAKLMALLKQAHEELEERKESNGARVATPRSKLREAILMDEVLNA